MFYAHCAGALLTFLIQIRILTSYVSMNKCEWWMEHTNERSWSLRGDAMSLFVLNVY